jgi:hypothetical protein
LKPPSAAPILDLVSINTAETAMEPKSTQSAFGRWEESHKRLLALERLLGEALVQYAKGQAPFPDRLHAEIAALRRERDALFDAAIAALRARDGSGQRTGA